jgi:hypothetical protein
VKRRAAGGGALKAWNGDAARALLDNLHEQIAANNFSAVSSWPLAARRSLMAAIETYRRLVVLAGELSDQLARIAPPRPAPARASRNSNRSRSDVAHSRLRRLARAPGCTIGGLFISAGFHTDSTFIMGRRS